MTELPINKSRVLYGVFFNSDGKPTSIHTLSWTSSDYTKVTISAVSNIQGHYAVTITPAIGAEIGDEAEITVVADADMGWGTRNIQASIDVVISAAIVPANEAATLEIREGALT